MLSHAVRNTDQGIYIRYRLDGSLFNLRRLNTKTKSFQHLLQDVLFADDCALVAHSECDLQLMLDRFSQASKLFGLTISLGKTEVLYQPAPNTTIPAPSITIDNTRLSNVNQFKYLGSTISHDASLDKEIDARIGRASQALGRLRNKVLNQHNIKMSTKIKVYHAIVLPSLLYGCETWSPYRRQIKKLETFHMRALRSILGIRWQDRVTNLEVLNRANSSSIESRLIKAQLRWVGHVIRMGEDRLPRILLYGELQDGKRNQGRPRKRYKDHLKENLHWCDLEVSELEECAKNRPRWRQKSHNAVISFEESRREKLKAARDKRHRPAAAITTTDFQCPFCARLCASKLGLSSHMRIHK